MSVDRGEVHARKMQFVDVPFAPAPAVCDETIDLGSILVATADDTME